MRLVEDVAEEAGKRDCFIGYALECFVYGTSRRCRWMLGQHSLHRWQQTPQPMGWK
jgi:hypothetical protein